MILKVIFIFLLSVTITVQQNCSTANKCGSNGYCYLIEDEIHCECKFWWDGETCNHMTGSGKQVIILGCLTAALIFIFYLLQIIRIIRTKRKQDKTDKKKETSSNLKLKQFLITYVKNRCKPSSCIIFILMILVAAGTLLAKWAVLKDIHHKIVDQYKKKQPIYYEAKSFCDDITYEQFNIVSISVACFVILVCIISTKRMSCKRKTCNGYGAPPMPINFLSHVDCRFSAVIFAIIADELFQIVQEVVGSSGSKDGILVTFLLRVFQVLVMGCRFFPILAAVYINSMLTLICATIHAWLDFAFTIIDEGICEPQYYPTYDEYIDNSSSIDDKLAYYGTNSELLAIELCIDIPRYLCLAYVSIKLPAMIIQKIRYLRSVPVTNEQKMMKLLSRDERILIEISNPDSVESLYVKNLFHSPDQRTQSQSIFSRIIPKFIYEWRDDFKFSSRIICLYASVFFLLYLVTCQAFIEVLPTLNIIQDSLQTTIDSIMELIDSTINLLEDAETEKPKVPFTLPLPSLVSTYVWALTITVIIIIVQLLLFLASIRRNLLQVYRRNTSEIPERQRALYITYATGNFHFAGYFIGYMVWGFVTILTIFMIICVCIGAFIKHGSVKALEQILKFIIPSLLLVIFKLFLNKFLAQYVFLQDFGDVLALDNRRFFTIFIYFNFFLDAFLGFISSILRFIKTAIATALYMCRLDYSPLGRKLESFDSGFSSYCGFIHTECTHRHPILLLFVSHLYAAIKRKEYEMNYGVLDMFPMEDQKIKYPRGQSRYIRKWKVAAFLVRNPAIVFFRKAFLNKLEKKEAQAINDFDNDDQSNTRRGAAFYTRQMAGQRPEFYSDIDPSQIVILKF